MRPLWHWLPLTQTRFPPHGTRGGCVGLGGGGGDGCGIRILGVGFDGAGFGGKYPGPEYLGIFCGGDGGGGGGGARPKNGF